MAKIYRVRYDRLPKETSEVKSKVYAEGHFRTFDLIASSEKEAIKIADRVHARQFAEQPEEVELVEGDVAVELGGPAVGVDPINAHSNYKLQGVEVIGDA